MDPVDQRRWRADPRRLTALRTASVAGFRAVPHVVAAAVATIVLCCATVASTGGTGMELSAGPEIASGSQETEPEGIDTTDPEASDEDGTGPPDWVMYVVIGAITAVLLVWYLRRLNRQDSAGG